MRLTDDDRRALAALADLDGQALRLRHRAENAPERAARTAAAAHLEKSRVALEQAGIREREARHVLDEVSDANEALRERIRRDQGRLDSGAGLSRELVALQHDIASLTTRLADREDEELRLMDLAESAEQQAAQLRAGVTAAEAAVAEATGAAENAIGALRTEYAALLDTRPGLAGAVSAQVLAVHERIAQRNGTGAALLSDGRCGACGMEIPPAELSRITAGGEVEQCEDCDRILLSGSP